MDDVLLLVPTVGTIGVAAIIVVSVVMVHDTVTIVAAFIVVVEATLAQYMVVVRDGIVLVDTCATFVTNQCETICATLLKSHKTGQKQMLLDDFMHKLCIKFCSHAFSPS